MHPPNQKPGLVSGLVEPTLVYWHLGKFLANCVRRATSGVRVFCPFVRTSALERLFVSASDDVSLSLTMRWDRRVFATGACDPGVFTLCRDLGVELRKLTGLHLKIILLDNVELIAGSANITERGLGFANVGNLEFVTAGLPARTDDLAHFDGLDRRSEPVTAEDYQEALTWFENRPADVAVGAPTREPMLSEIPCSQSPAVLWGCYSGHAGARGAEQADLALMRIPPGLGEGAFVDLVREVFLSTQLMLDLTEELRGRELYFGELKSWLVRTCVDAEGLGVRDVTGYADRLLNWIEGLGAPRYTIERPNVSERVRYKTGLGSEAILRAPGIRSTRKRRRGRRYEQ